MTCATLLQLNLMVSISVISFDQDDFTEEALEAHETELQKVKDYFELNKEMFERVAKRQKLWNEFIAFEVGIFSPLLIVKLSFLLLP